MIRSEETGSIHGTFKMISSLKAKTMQRQQSKKRGAGIICIYFFMFKYSTLLLCTVFKLLFKQFKPR